MGEVLYDKLTIERINSMHPLLRDSLVEDYIEINKRLPKNIRLRFSYTYRSFAEQDALYAIGRTKPGKKVTNARGGQSYHNYGLAFDIVLLVDKNGDGKFTDISYELDKIWYRVVNFFIDKGWEWGGHFKNFKDYPHFQNTFGKSIQELKNLPNFVSGNNKYPKI